METKENTNIHKGHRERLRNTTSAIGFENLPEHQQLELLLSFVIPRKDTNPIAHELIKKFGSFSAVLDANPINLVKVSGIGETAANFLSACGKIPFAYRTSKMKQKTVLTCPSQIIEYFNDIATATSTERFYTILLNSKSEVIKYEIIGDNSLDKVSVDFRELVQKILMHNAKGIIICHTHPEGSANPSRQDIEFTKQLFTALTIIGIKLCDHIIFAPNGEFSFFNEGIIDGFYKDTNYDNSSPRNTVNSPQINFYKD